MLTISRFKTTYRIIFEGTEICRLSYQVNQKEIDWWLINKLRRRNYFIRKKNLYLILKYGQKLIKDNGLQ